MKRFENQVAVISGGADGLGYGIAERIASEGGSIALFDINESLLTNALKKLKDNYPDIIDEGAEAGDPHPVCANTPIGSVEEVKKSIDTLNKASEAAKKSRNCARLSQS